MRQRRIPCLLMRGGTSKGAFFLADDLPADPAQRDAVLLAVMGSPDLRQIDGLGGADPLTSKVAIVRRSARPDATSTTCSLRSASIGRRSTTARTAATFWRRSAPSPLNAGWSAPAAQ